MKTWNDQPDQISNLPIAFDFYNGERHVEVRAGAEPEDPALELRCYYVSVGNLFGSQTVRLHGEDKLFEVLRLASSTKRGKKTDLPSGVKVL